LHSSVMPCTNQANFVPSKTIKSYMKTHELRNENLFTWKAKITKKANTYATKLLDLALVHGHRSDIVL
ncbi:hypothetical protein, partial [Herbaspirillum rubrisubalbicans]|uniref:hypothetical protein n=1 Tax=Herbaspirillum rubrisubalbicans TaxID=80842 RepID=UPI001C12F587